MTMEFRLGKKGNEDMGTQGTVKRYLDQLI